MECHLNIVKQFLGHGMSTVVALSPKFCKQSYKRVLSIIVAFITFIRRLKMLSCHNSSIYKVLYRIRKCQLLEEEKEEVKEQEEQQKYKEEHLRCYPHQFQLKKFGVCKHLQYNRSYPQQS
ncbi:MAG: hypothetical protein MHMPM18_004627 [Marteilia pararefringens]